MGTLRNPCREARGAVRRSVTVLALFVLGVLWAAAPAAPGASGATASIRQVATAIASLSPAICDPALDPSPGSAPHAPSDAGLHGERGETVMSVLASALLIGLLLALPAVVIGRDLRTGRPDPGYQEVDA